jgi:hypothetical protein
MEGKQNMWSLGQSKMQYAKKVNISSLTLRLSYNYHKVASN